MELASYKGTGHIQKVVSEVTNAIESSGITAELMQRTSHRVDGHQIILLGFEKYYYRSRNQVMLTVMFVESDNDEIYVDMISGGSSVGVFLKIDWGASKNFLGSADQALKRLGFTRIK